MFAISILAPGLILGAIVWAAIGILRQRGKEPFTLVTAAAFYANVIMLAGILVTLAGIAVLVKLGLSRIDPSYAYFVPSGYSGPYGPPAVNQQETQDLLLALTLTSAGIVIGGGHWFLARYLGRRPGGTASWIGRGVVLALVVLTGLAGFLSLLIGGYQALSYFIVGNVSGGMTFADAAGAATAFLPAWAVALAFLLRSVRREPLAPAAGTPALT